MATAADRMAQSISLGKFAQATDLKKRLWFTIGALIVFRLLSYVPLPGIDPVGLPAWPAARRAACWTSSTPSREVRCRAPR